MPELRTCLRWQRTGPAIAHYEQSADYYKGEESNSSANKCLLKVATYAAQLEQYQKAVEIYEQVKSLFLILTFVFIA
ncbi:hypothetical protein AB205_0189650 [Aquarana catesbeiana]|uniref:Uncharacterized protein n=1 Tax=Aquarana catesbeiana TaxID=8400 RepID=A0A2G9RKX2_AQUCT|nr:hypothetical protein AB205_0189650 [Aquarana catesbeiana]